MSTPMFHRFAPFLLILSLPVCAELYQWTDEHGKTHFGDRPPSAQTSTIEITVQNNDFELLSEESAAYYNRISENKALSEHEKAQQEQKTNSAKEKACQKAKSALATLRGPVYFTDDDGEEFEISEKEREARANELAEKIQHYCS